MNKGPRPQRGRNSSIIRQYRAGKSPSALAAQFRISRNRIYQIIAGGIPVERRRAKLEKKYGAHPRLSILSDRTPIEVLCLYRSPIPRWEARIHRLRHSSVGLKTLGDLRHVSDSVLLSKPKIG